MEKPHDVTFSLKDFSTHSILLGLALRLIEFLYEGVHFGDSLHHFDVFVHPDGRPECADEFVVASEDFLWGENRGKRIKSYTLIYPIISCYTYWSRLILWIISALSTGHISYAPPKGFLRVGCIL